MDNTSLRQAAIYVMRNRRQLPEGQSNLRARLIDQNIALLEATAEAYCLPVEDLAQEIAEIDRQAEIGRSSQSASPECPPVASGLATANDLEHVRGKRRGRTNNKAVRGHLTQKGRGTNGQNANDMAKAEKYATDEDCDMGRRAERARA